jgi:2-methylcitrate dehydratase PrpD
MLKIREDHHLDHRQIKAITCQVHPARYPHINVPDPDTALAAKFSVHYCLALAAIKGRLEISDFEGELNRSDDVRRLMRSVTFGRYEDNDNISGSNVTITTVDDRSYHVSIEGAYGSSVERALSPAVLHTKFMDCTKRVLSATVADRLYDMLVQLEKIEDVREIIRKSCTVEQDGGRDASNPQGYTRRADDHLGTVCL